MHRAYTVSTPVSTQKKSLTEEQRGILGEALSLYDRQYLTCIKSALPMSYINNKCSLHVYHILKYVYPNIGTKENWP